MNILDEKEDLGPHIPWQWKFNTMLIQQPSVRADFVFQGLHFTKAEQDWITERRIDEIPVQWGFRKPPLTTPYHDEDTELFRVCGFQGHPWGLTQVCFQTNWQHMNTDMERLFPQSQGFSLFAATAMSIFTYSLLYMHFPMAKVFDPSDVATQIRDLIALIDFNRKLPNTLYGMMRRFRPIVSDVSQIREMTQALHRLIFDQPERASQFLDARQMLDEFQCRPRSAAFFTMLVAMDTLLRLAVPGTHGQALAQCAAFANALENYMALRENALDDEHQYWEIDVSDPMHPTIVLDAEDRYSPASTLAFSGACSSECSPSQTNTTDHSPSVDSIQSL